MKCYFPEGGVRIGKRMIMQRYFTLISVATLFVCTYIQPVFADEYGERFYNHTPNGLAEYTVPAREIPDVAMDEDLANELQGIMPAAGEEGDSVMNDPQSQSGSNDVVEDLTEEESQSGTISK